MNSCLFEGKILHARLNPTAHRFWFKAFYFYLDLDELERVFAKSFLFSTTRRAFARFRFGDHLAASQPNVSNKTDFRNAIIGVLRKHDITSPIGPIRLLTQLRYLGFVMNPVNFYFCFDESGIRVEAIIAEVNNTPWGEQHLYVINGSTHANPPAPESKQRISANNVTKEFHVSPFMPLHMTYDFDFSFDPENLTVKIASFEKRKKVLNVCMSLKRKPITATTLGLSLLKYPLFSWKIFAGIYWQALRLHLKRIPFYPHPRNQLSDLNNEPEHQLSAFAPNASHQIKITKIDESESIAISQ